MVSCKLIIKWDHKLAIKTNLTTRAVDFIRNIKGLKLQTSVSGANGESRWWHWTTFWQGTLPFVIVFTGSEGFCMQLMHPRAPRFYPPSTPCMFFRNALSTPSWKVFDWVQKKMSHVTAASSLPFYQMRTEMGLSSGCILLRQSYCCKQGEWEKKDGSAGSAHCFNMKENQSKWHQICSFVTEMQFFPL